MNHLKLPTWFEMIYHGFSATMSLKQQRFSMVKGQKSWCGCTACRGNFGIWFAIIFNLAAGQAEGVQTSKDWASEGPRLMIAVSRAADDGKIDAEKIKRTTPRKWHGAQLCSFHLRTIRFLIGLRPLIHALYLSYSHKLVCTSWASLRKVVAMNSMLAEGFVWRTKRSPRFDPVAKGHARPLSKSERRPRWSTRKTVSAEYGSWTADPGGWFIDLKVFVCVCVMSCLNPLNLQRCIKENIVQWKQSFEVVPGGISPLPCKVMKPCKLFELFLPFTRISLG